MLCRGEQETTTRSLLISVLSVLAHDIYDEAIIDIVSPDSLASQPYLLKDLHLQSTLAQSRLLLPFTLTSTTPKRTKIHAPVLYFDTFFASTDDAVPPSVPVKVTKEGDATLVEVWPVGGQPPPHRRARRIQCAYQAGRVMHMFQIILRRINVHTMCVQGWNHHRMGKFTSTYKLILPRFR
ncbi:hypothetical protein M405DRAFT_505488 [Rhizopogon salebrosus TDB-379]|nr:hypothetical protein M405DRAFT_505488 [Rhizopogon salebrosus TDB-379]